MMNTVYGPNQRGTAKSVGETGEEADLDFGRIARAARRQLWVILAFCAIGVAGGLAYTAQSVPRYTASAVLIIDSVKDKTSISASIADLTYDSGAIDSQLEVLKSEGTASSVLNSLKLEDNYEFNNPPVSVLSRWSGAIRSLLRGSSADQSAQDSEVEKARKARRSLLDQLESNLAVRRVGRSYVINVDYTSTDPDLAATIANGFAQAYVGDQLAAKFNAMQQTKEWLEKRTAEFKQKWIQSDRALQDRKAQIGLITSDGRLLGDQQVGQLGAELTAAQSDTARATARYRQLESLIASGEIDGDVPDTLSSPTINELRTAYRRTAQIAQQAADAGAPDGQATALQTALAGYKAQILTEMRRILESYRSDADVAQSKEDGLRKALNELARKNTADDQQLVTLRVLEQDANSNRKIYEGLLQRYQDVQERQTFPEAEARIITSAAPPTAPAYPKRPVVTALALVLGLLAGLGVAAIRENHDQVFRTAADARERLHLEFLGMLPIFKAPRLVAARSEEGAASGRLHARDPVMRMSLDHPFSSYSETMRSVKIALDLSTEGNGAKVVGIISATPGEGKSTVAKNLASLLGRAGNSVLLIDADLHQRGLTTALTKDTKAGLFDVMYGRKPLSDCVLVEDESGVSFLPTVTEGGLPHSSHVLSSPQMRELTKEARRTFDYVVIDLPPVGPLVGVRAAASLFDGLLVVVEWGRTSQALVKNVLFGDSEIARKCIGVVYNKVKMSRIKLYEGQGSSAFHHAEFTDYLKSGTGPV